MKVKIKKQKDKRVRVPEHKKVLIILCVIFSIYAAALLFVFGWLFVNSFKTPDEFNSSLWSLPKNLGEGLKNYVRVWEFEYLGQSFITMFKNSLLLCLIMPTISCFITSFASYALAKFNFKGKKFIYFIYILPMMFTICGTQITLYSLMDTLNLVNHIYGLVIMGAGAGGMNFLLLYGTYKNISDTYMEAAEIDGAGDFRIYFQIMLPQALGIIGTLWMFGFINTWNDYATVQLFIPERQTIAVGLESIRAYFAESFYNDYPTYYAGIVISLIPILILFMCFQEQIMKLSLGGGIKG